MPEDYADYCLASVLRVFQAQHAEVRPDICCEMSTALVSRLLRGELDLVVGVQHDNQQQGEYLCDEPLVWVAAPGWRGAENGPVALAVYAEGCAFRANAVRALAQAGRPWHVVCTSQSPRGIRIAIEQGQSVGVTAQRLVPDGWQVLGERQGFPAIEPARLMFWRSAQCQVPAVEDLVSILWQQLGASEGLAERRFAALPVGHQPQ